MICSDRGDTPGFVAFNMRSHVPADFRHGSGYARATPRHGRAMRRFIPSPMLWAALLAIVLALGFLGSRGIWDPDEGRYTNVALNMLSSGDWINPHRNAEVGHWTKPPLTYWAIASSVAVFGYNPFAARLPAALAYLLCAWLVFRIARRLAPGSELPAAVIYATMLLPLGASQLITTDYVLAACETLAVWAFVEARFGDGAHRRRWMALMWAAFALAFMTKGPPGLVPLPALLLFGQLMPKRTRNRVLQVSGIVLFALLALPWYIAVMLGNPGLFEYFIGDEVINRVTTNEFGRHGEWYGWLQIYLPTLILGTLPWTPALWRWSRTLPADLRRWWRDPGAREADARWLFLAVWLLLPLLVFCLSKSRLPLYILPLWAPLAVLAAMQRQREGRPLPHWRWLLLWAVVLLALKLATAYWPTHKNAAEWAHAIRARTSQPIQDVVFVEDMARYGLHLHLGPGIEIERIALDGGPQSRFNPYFDETLASELGKHEPNALWICKQEFWPTVQARIAALGYRAVAQGTPYQRRIIFRVAPGRDAIAR